MANNETVANIIAEMRDEAARADMEQDYSTDDAAEMMREFAWRIDAAQRRDCASIERIVRDAMLGYGEMFRIAPNDESEAELKTRAETANTWLERHGFAREEIRWTKEEASEL